MENLLQPLVLRGQGLALLLHGQELALERRVLLAKASHADAQLLALGLLPQARPAGALAVALLPALLLELALVPSVQIVHFLLLLLGDLGQAHRSHLLRVWLEGVLGARLGVHRGVEVDGVELLRLRGVRGVVGRLALRGAAVARAGLGGHLQSLRGGGHRVRHRQLGGVGRLGRGSNLADGLLEEVRWQALAALHGLRCRRVQEGRVHARLSRRHLERGRHWEDRRRVGGAGTGAGGLSRPEVLGRGAEGRRLGRVRRVLQREGRLRLRAVRGRLRLVERAQRRLPLVHILGGVRGRKALGKAGGFVQHLGVAGRHCLRRRGWLGCRSFREGVVTHQMQVATVD
mmetsp:Transcript_27195/g.57612  ORF Transcript_27195/g.57612 Transcript_27195/m.57612 type:complete len:345 (+) Transcript_27195:685-1719(+)